MPNTYVFKKIGAQLNCVYSGIHSTFLKVLSISTPLPRYYINTSCIPQSNLSFAILSGNNAQYQIQNNKYFEISTSNKRTLGVVSNEPPTEPSS